MTRKLSQITFYENVPLHDDFKHSLLFDTEVEQSTFFEQYHNTKFDILDSSYQRVEFQIRTPFKFEDVQNINYVKVVNPSYDGDQNAEYYTWYGFVDKPTYMNDGTVFLSWSVDPIQTFMFRWSLNNATIERAHLNEYTTWNSKIMPVFQEQALVTRESIGNTGETFVREEESFSFIVSDQYQDDNITWLVFVVTPQMGDLKDQTKHNTMSTVGLPTQYRYFILPFNNETMQIYDCNFQLDGSSVYNFSTQQDLEHLMYTIATGGKFVFNGTNSNIVSAYVTKSIGIPISLSESTITVNAKSSDGFTTGWVKEFSDIPSPIPPIPDPRWQMYIPEIVRIPNFHNEHSNIVTEAFTFLYNIYKRLGVYKEFGDYPPVKIFYQAFFNMKVGDGRGNEMVLNLSNFSAPFSPIQLTRSGALGLMQKTAYYIDSYQYQPTGLSQTPNLQSQAHVTMIDNTDTAFPVILDNFTSYWQSNKNQINNSYANARMTLKNTQTSNSNMATNLGIGQTAQVQTTNNNNALSQRNLLMTLSTSVGGSMNNLASDIGSGYNSFFESNADSRSLGAMATSVTNFAQGHGYGDISQQNLTNDIGKFINFYDMASAQGSASNMGATIANTNQNLAIQQGADSRQLLNNVNTSNKIATNNYDVAVNTINAGLADMKNSSDNVASQGTNIMFDYGYDMLTPKLFGFSALESNIKSAIQYYSQFGYMNGQYYNIDSFLIANKRTKFNYIKTIGLRTTGNVPLQYRRILNVIFDSGITLWHDVHSFEQLDITNNIQTTGI